MVRINSIYGSPRRGSGRISVAGPSLAREAFRPNPSAIMIEEYPNNLFSE
jgi:hypothetical protein